MRRFFAPPERFEAGTVTLSAEETRHLRDVLRLKAGDEARVFDGDGGEFLCVITEVRKSVAILSVLDKIRPSFTGTNPRPTARSTSESSQPPFGPTMAVIFLAPSVAGIAPPPFSENINRSPGLAPAVAT